MYNSDDGVIRIPHNFLSCLFILDNIICRLISKHTSIKKLSKLLDREM